MVIDNRYIEGIILIRDFLKRKESIDIDDSFSCRWFYNLDIRLDLISIYNRINNTNISELSINDYFVIATGENLHDKTYSNLNKIIREHTLKDIISNN